MAIEDRLAEYAGAVDAATASLLASGPAHQGLYDMVRYHLGWLDRERMPTVPIAKKLRPSLCLLVADAVGGSWRVALPAATAVELVHNFSLIHDDIQDGSRLRRHRDTVWAVWGTAQGINTGDTLLIIAEQALSEVEPRLPPGAALGAYRLLLQACRALCEGQYLDLLWEHTGSITVEDYLGMIERKTARLFACAAELGAYCAEAQPERQEAFRALGQALGMAFQVADDIAGIWSPEIDTGKSAATDLMSRKKTLPVLLGLASPASPAADRLREAFAKSRALTEAEARQAAGWLDDLGMREQALAMLRRYGEEASGLLASAAPGNRATELQAFLTSMLPGV